MASTVGQIIYEIEAKVDGLKSGLDKARSLSKQTADQLENDAGKAADGVGSKFGKLAAGIGAAFAAVQVGGFLKDSFKGFQESEAAAAQLRRAVVDVTGATEEQLVSTNKLAEALSAKGVLDDDAIKTGLAQLSTFGLSNDAVQGLGGSLADLAVNQFGVSASGEQLSDSANMIAKALNGQFGILEKSGIRFTEAQKRIIEFGTEQEKVAAINEGFAQNLKYTNEIAAQTSEGGMARLSVQFGNFKESIGAVLNSGLQKIAPLISDVVSGIAASFELLKTGDFQGGIFGLEEDSPFIGFLFKIRELMPGIIGFFKTLWSNITPIIPVVISAFGALLGAIGKIAGTIQTQFGPVLNLVVELFQKVATKIQENKAFFEGLWNIITTVAGVIVTVLAAAFRLIIPVIGFVIDVIFKVIGWITAFVNFVISIPATISGAFEAVKGLFQGLGDKVTGTVGGILQQFPLVTTAWNFVVAAIGFGKDILVAAFNIIRDTIAVAVSVIQGIFTALTIAWNVVVAIFNAGKDAILAVFNFLKTIISAEIEAIKFVFSSLADAWNWVVAIVSNGVNAIISFFSNLYNSVVGIVNGLVGAVTGFFSNLFSSVTANVSNLVNTVVSFFTGLPGRIISGIGSLFSVFSGWISSAGSIGKQIVDAILAGIGDIGGAIKSKIGDGIGSVGSIVSGLIPGFAGGVTNFGGGVAIVGEEGPELVTLPRGSNVLPAGKTKSAIDNARKVGGTGGGKTTVVVLPFAAPFKPSQQELRDWGDMVASAMGDRSNALGIGV